MYLLSSARRRHPGAEGPDSFAAQARAVAATPMRPPSSQIPFYRRVSSESRQRPSATVAGEAGRKDDSASSEETGHDDDSGVKPRQCGPGHRHAARKAGAGLTIPVNGMWWRWLRPICAGRFTLAANKKPGLQVGLRSPAIEAGPEERSGDAAPRNAPTSSRRSVFSGLQRLSRRKQLEERSLRSRVLPKFEVLISARPAPSSTTRAIFGHVSGIGGQACQRGVN